MLGDNNVNMKTFRAFIYSSTA